MAETQTNKTPEEIAAYENVKSTFDDYPRFEGEAEERAAQKQAFIGGYEYIPTYDYKKLTFLLDDETVRQKKTTIQEAVMELEAAKQKPENNAAELELYAQFHEQRLKKIFLVEAARDLLKPYNSAAEETAREAFMALNEEVYGAFNAQTYKGMLATESRRLETFIPSNRQARHLKEELQDFFNRLELGDGAVEKDLMSPEELEILHHAVTERYHNVLAAVPETGDDVFYNATDSAAIINSALAAGGLAEDGWESVVDPLKQNPLTSPKKIKLPLSTRRTAQQLRRLDLHEQEVHARRAENGKATGINLLASGTADYADVEEGMGVLFEVAFEGNFDNPSFYRARDRYITGGLVIGADSAPRDARESYEILWRMLALRSEKDGAIYEDDILAAKELAFTHIGNAFRGTSFFQKGVIYTKLKVYYEGLAKNAAYFSDAIKKGTLNEAIDLAMTGKFNHTDPTETVLIQEIIAAKAT